MSSTTPDPWNVRLPAAAQDRFTAIGWTRKDWFNCSTVRRTAPTAFSWLMDPPEFIAPITPDEYTTVTRRYGWRSPVALTALAGGVPARLVHAAMAESQGSDPERCWDIAQQLGWSEDQAVGWSRAGFLQSKGWATGHENPTTVVIRRTRKLTKLSGADGYLWVLAGYDANEAIKVVRAGGPVSLEQLQVMAVLNGADLSA